MFLLSLLALFLFFLLLPWEGLPPAGLRLEDQVWQSKSCNLACVHDWAAAWALDFGLCWLGLVLCLIASLVACLLACFVVSFSLLVSCLLLFFPFVL